MSEQELKDFIHQEIKDASQGPSWLERNASWVLTSSLAICGFVVGYTTLQTEFKNHKELPWHAGSANVQIRLGVIERDIKEIKEVLKEIRTEQDK